MISWSYYGEQGEVFLFGDRMVLTYKFVYCALIIIATWGFIESDADLDNLTGVGTGVMLWANVPIMWLFVNQAMRSYHDYIHRLKTGQLKQSSMWIIDFQPINRIQKLQIPYKKTTYSIVIRNK